jgi:hypothetical protein
MWALAMQAAYGQALGYAQTVDDPPPFLIVCDIGYCFDLYATFDGSRNYRDYPTAQRKRIYLRDLAIHVDLLREIFLSPRALDPAKRTTKVTRAIAAHLAELARDLEAKRYDADDIATFLMRCIFTMFAEDAGLLPERTFTMLLEKEWMPHPERFADEVTQLWERMNTGGALIGVGKILHFNGGLFAHQKALPLTRDQLQLLHEASRANWVDVEPAIFGTLLERALDPRERHALGAHFTPRAYVERLVRPTIEEPLRAEWDIVRAHVQQLLTKGKSDVAPARRKALAALHAFHRRLCRVSVLDPACGTGNFLYVTLDVLKRLESEVFQLLADLGETQTPLEMASLTVTPAQFHGIEVKPWAKEIADLVLWIGYLQWLMRTRGDTGHIPEPVLQQYGNIECRDAVLAWDAVEPLRDDRGDPVTRWDGVSTKASPITGAQIPDEEQRIAVVHYINPRRATWPAAEFIVGNPPFIGNKRMRLALGDGYVDALRSAHRDVPEGADFVMYWWNQAARLVREGATKRFGLITTKSIAQVLNRGVIATHLSADDPVSIVFAIPNHPWVDAAQGAAVRVAMTSAVRGTTDGRLLEVVRETAGEGDDSVVELRERRGRIQENLQIGPASGKLARLRANSGLSFMGVTLVGQGFILDAEDELRAHEPEAVKPYVTGGELNQTRRNRFVIDLFPRSEAEARTLFPASFQRVLDRVRPERLQNARAVYREKWWLHAEPRPALRAAVADLDQFIAICRTAKHRVFQMLPAATLVESTVVAIGLSDYYYLGVLSSRPHVAFSLLVGTRLGVGDDPRYNNSLCFDPFPFPVAAAAQEARIRELARRLDEHRNTQQSTHPDLTMTAMYNVLEKAREGTPLTAKERVIHEHGLISILSQIHDELDTAVVESYRWAHDISNEEIVERLVALNAERAAEEETGVVRWLRTALQNPSGSEALHAGLVDASGRKSPSHSRLPPQTRSCGQSSSLTASPQFVASSRTRAARSPPPTCDERSSGRRSKTWRRHSIRSRPSASFSGSCPRTVRGGRPLRNQHSTPA